MSAPSRPFEPERILRVVLPLATLALGVFAWHLVVKIYALPPIKLPGPGLVWDTLVDDRWLDFIDGLDIEDPHAFHLAYVLMP